MQWIIQWDRRRLKRVLCEFALSDETLFCFRMLCPGISGLTIRLAHTNPQRHPSRLLTGKSESGHPLPDFAFLSPVGSGRIVYIRAWRRNGR